MPLEETAPDPAVQGIETIASIRAKAERSIDKHQRAVEVITAALGRPITLYSIVALALLWTALNLAMPTLLGMPPLDPPPFPWLQGCVAFCALLMTTLVLITENRQTRHAEERAHLDFQVNLLTEQKVAKLIALVEELRRDMPMVRNRVDREAESMQHAVDRSALLGAMDSATDSATDSSTVEKPPAT